MKKYIIHSIIAGLIILPIILLIASNDLLLMSIGSIYTFVLYKFLNKKNIKDYIVKKLSYIKE